MDNKYLKLLAETLDPELSVFATMGKPVIPMNLMINIQKVGTIFVMFALMIYYNNFSLAAWTYLALHGSYGLIWLLKEYVFADPGFKRQINTLTASILASVLVLYWGIGLQVMNRYSDNNISYERICIAIFMFVFGVILMVGCDLQKFVTLKYKKGLISDGFLAINRNTNYFGEMLLYASFAVISPTYISWGILITYWSTIFVSRIYLKERSLMKKEGYKEYAKRSYLILFKFFEDDIKNIIFYCSIIIGGYFIYVLGGIEKTLKLAI